MKATVLILVFSIFLASFAAGQAPCYGSCQVTTDCDQTGSCPICRIGICVGTGACGSTCQDNSNCYAGTCLDCVHGECVSLCGAPCQQSSDCLWANTTCVTCERGVCQVGGCGSNCGSDADCAGQGNCTTCTYNKCYSACGKPCTENNECNDAYTGCGLCQQGICQYGNVCGQTCAGNNDCSGSCTLCNGGKCTQGYPCGFSCVVDTDCQQYPTSCSACTGGFCQAP